MFSSLFVRLSCVLVAVFSIILISGCDTRVGEQPPSQEAQEFAGAKCLSETPPVVEAFMKGTAKPEQLEAAWGCAIGAIEKFKRYVRGRSADRYTVQELATFLENNFLDQNAKNGKIPVALQTDFMKLKRVFVGGALDYLSLNEMNLLIDLFRSLRAMTIGLNPYMKVLAMQWSVQTAMELPEESRYFEESNRALQEAAKTLASLIEKNGASYQLSEFVIFTENLNKFFGQNWSFPKKIATYMPVVKKVKKALAGGDEDSITSAEWRRFALLGARGYIQFLRYYYFIKTVPESGSGYRLSYLARSVEDILSVFQDLVAEKPSGVVSRDEATELLKTLEVVWPDFKISSGLIYEVMKLKQLFFGGDLDSISTSDFKSARLKVSLIKSLVEGFLPYYAVYGHDWDPEMLSPEEAQKFFAESQLTLEKTFRELGLLFEGEYDLKNLTQLAEEIEKLYPASNKGLKDSVNRYLPLIVDSKKMILGGQDSILKKSQWSVLLRFGARFYSQSLYYDYFVKNKGADRVRYSNNLSYLVNQSLDVLRDLLLTKEDPRFLRSELIKIVQDLAEAEVLPKKVGDSSADALLSLVLNQILVSPAQRIEGFKPESLTIESVEVFRQETRIWLEMDGFIARWTEHWRADEGIVAKEAQEVLLKAQKDSATSIELNVAIKEMLLSLQSPVPLTYDNENRAVIGVKAELLYTAHSLSQLNLHRAIARWLMRSVITSMERLNSYAGVNLEEVEKAFSSVRPFLVDIGILNPKNLTFASSRFREANIFVPHSDGNDLASHAEVTDLVGMIWSGINLNTMLRQELIRVCFNGVDQQDSAKVSLSCARKAYKGASPQVMRATPDYLKFMSSSSADEWAYFINNIFKAAGYIPNEKNLVALEDLSLSPHVIQYVEMVFSRFDRNKDGFMSTAEALKAFPAFKGILKELSKDQIDSGTIKEKDLVDVFTYILRYGKPPESISQKAYFYLAIKGLVKKWDVWADRTQMAEILGYIADEVNKSTQKKVKSRSTQAAL